MKFSCESSKWSSACIFLNANNISIQHSKYYFKHLFSCLTVKIENICNLIGCNSVHSFDIFNCYRANINGVWNAGKLGGIYETFEFILTKNIHVSLNSSKVRLCFNQQIIAPRFAAVKISCKCENLCKCQHWNQQLNWYVSKVIKCLEQNVRKQIDCKRPSNNKQMNRLQNIRIEIWKYKAVRKYKT